MQPKAQRDEGAAHSPADQLLRGRRPSPTAHAPTSAAGTPPPHASPTQALCIPRPTTRLSVSTSTARLAEDARKSLEQVTSPRFALSLDSPSIITGVPAEGGMCKFPGETSADAKAAAAPSPTPPTQTTKGAAALDDRPDYDTSSIGGAANEYDDDGAQHAARCERWRKRVRTKRNAGLLTPWGEKLEADDVVRDAYYPRPTMQRDDWVCLNGFWEYAVTVAAKGLPPEGFDGDILVPFPVESVLSGVAGRVTDKHFLWYRRAVRVPAAFDRDTQRVILHFGAVDWQTIVYVNGQAAKEHCGGFDAFEVDITPYLNLGASPDKDAEIKQEITIRVFDPTDQGLQPRGKQCLDPQTSERVVAPLGMWYTPVSGIWQTVWMECVPKAAYIQRMQITPDLDRRCVDVRAHTMSEPGIDELCVLVRLLSGTEEVGRAWGPAGEAVRVALRDDHRTIKWTPDRPFLYDLEVALFVGSQPEESGSGLGGGGEGEKAGGAIDAVKGYTAMRKISVAADVNGTVRLQLNNKDLFQYGVLDQGWWPDGLYTPASDAALEWDVRTIKQLGFNMVRKHIKVEPQRWYYHCDRLGLLVWQDMPNGSVPAKWAPGGVHDFSENPVCPLYSKIFEDELKAMVDALRNHPSITTWVPFNEAWGQYNSVAVVQWLEAYDPGRLVWVSGGNDFGVGSAIDRHVYSDPVLPSMDGKRVAVLGEFGGLGHAVEGHGWANSSSSSQSPSHSRSMSSTSEDDDDYASFVEWGYSQVESLSALTRNYLDMLDRVKELSMAGLGAAVYTQLSDVERESNGLVTYNRRVVKLDVSLVRKAHRRLLSSASTILSKSSRDLVSMLQESVQRMPKSHTVTNLANLHCSFEEGGAGAEGGEIGHAVLSHSPRRTIPRCTSLSTIFVSSNG